MKTFKELLIELDACSPALEWLKDRTIEETIRDVDRGDWLLWLAKALCAKTVIHLMKDERSINAVNVAEKFGRGECTRKDLDATANATANAAAYAAYAAAYAAAAANAAANANATANAAAYAAYAAYAAAAANAAAAAAAAAAANANLLETSIICKEILGELIINRVNKLLK